MLTSEEKGLAASAGGSWIRNTEGRTAHPPTCTHRHTLCPPGAKDVPSHVPRPADTTLGGSGKLFPYPERGAGSEQDPTAPPQPRRTLL